LDLNRLFDGLFLCLHITVFNQDSTSFIRRFSSRRVVQEREPGSKFACPLGYSFANNPITGPALNK